MTFHNVNTIAITQEVSSKKNSVFNYTQQLHKKNTDPIIFSDVRFVTLGHPNHFLIPLAKSIKLQRREKSCFTCNCHIISQGHLWISDDLTKLKGL